MKTEMRTEMGIEDGNGDKRTEMEDGNGDKSIRSSLTNDGINMELTSIIIVAHNQLEFTRLCVESIERHTSEPYELIFVDNGSRDATVEYLKGIGSRESGTAENTGVGNRESGIAEGRRPKRARKKGKKRGEKGVGSLFRVND